MSAEYEAKEPKLSIEVGPRNDVHYVGELSEHSFWLKTRKWIRSIGAEEFGIERIPEELRTNQPPRDYFTVFFVSSL
jgi:hypothetical protein